MRTILILALIFIVSSSQAQLSITSTSSVPSTIGSFTSAMEGSQGILTSVIKNGDTTYTLKFRLDSHEYTKWNTITFKETGGTLNGLYDLLNNFFSKENKKNSTYNKTFQLGGQDVTCISFRTTNTSIEFKTKEGMFMIHERQLKMLFGK